MARDAAAWRWYANLNDDVRHQLIDRAWFDQNQRDNAFAQDVADMEVPEPPRWPPDPQIEPGIDPEFDEPDHLRDFYGDYPSDQPEAGDWYGPPDIQSPDIEPEPEP